jgi:hypothetical protein
MEIKKFNEMQSYLVENIGNSKGAFRNFVKQDRDAERLEFQTGGIADELKKFVRDFISKNGRIPTQNEIIKGTGRASKTIKSYLTEGTDYAKPLTKLEAAKLGGKKPTGVTGISEDILREFKNLKTKGVSVAVETSPAGSKVFRVRFDKKLNVRDISMPATMDSLNKIKADVDRVVSSSEYSEKIKPFRTEEETRQFKRDKAAVYRKQDPYRVYERLSKYKTFKYPDISKDIIIHHSQPKFKSQMLSRFSLIPQSLNISEPMLKAETARNAIIANRDMLLQNPDLSLDERKRIINETNAKQTRLKNNLKGPVKGLIDFELLEVDAAGNVSTKSKGFDTKKGMTFADELGDLDLSKITQEQADELVELGKKNIDLQALSKIKGVSFASQLNARIPYLQELFDLARSIPDDLNKKNYLKAGGKILGLAFTPVIAYDTYKAYEEGKPILEALEQGFIGTDLIGSAKRLVSLTPEEREARSVVKQDEMTQQIAQDESFLDTDFDTPKIDTELKLPKAKEIFEKGKKRVKGKEAQKNLERATKRSNLKQMILDKLFPDPRQQLELAGGGIVKEGGVDEGPAPEAGPTPDGLPIKYNNVKKVKE